MWEQGFEPPQGTASEVIGYLMLVYNLQFRNEILMYYFVSPHQETPNLEADNCSTQTRNGGLHRYRGLSAFPLLVGTGG